MSTYRVPKCGRHFVKFNDVTIYPVLVVAGTDYIKLIWESPTTEDNNLNRHLRSFSIQNSNQMASRLTTSFPRLFFQPLQLSRQRPSFSAHRAALMTRTHLIFSADKIFKFRSSTLLSLHSTRSDTRVRFVSGVIFLNQSQFFATHSNQLNRFILYR